MKFDDEGSRGVTGSHEGHGTGAVHSLVFSSRKGGVSETSCLSMEPFARAATLPEPLTSQVVSYATGAFWPAESRASSDYSGSRGLRYCRRRYSGARASTSADNFLAYPVNDRPPAGHCIARISSESLLGQYEHH